MLHTTCLTLLMLNFFLLSKVFLFVFEILIVFLLLYKWGFSLTDLLRAKFFENITIKVIIHVFLWALLLFGNKWLFQMQRTVIVLSINWKFDLFPLLVLRIDNRIASLVDRDGSLAPVWQQRVLFLAQFALVGFYLIGYVRQIVLIKSGWDVLGHEDPRMLQVILCSPLLRPEQRSHTITWRSRLHILHRTVISCRERRLWSVVQLVCLRWLEIGAQITVQVLNRKLIVEVDRLYLLGDHFYLVEVAALATHREPLLDLHAIAWLLFLKRTLKH